MSIEILAPLLAAGAFGIVSGFNDGGNLIASFTSGRVITPGAADMAADDISVIVIKRT